MSESRRPTIFEEAMERPSETRGCMKGIAFTVANADGHTAKTIGLICAALADIAADSEATCLKERNRGPDGAPKPHAGRPAEFVHGEWRTLLRGIGAEACKRATACGLKLPPDSKPGMARPDEP